MRKGVAVMSPTTPTRVAKRHSKRKRLFFLITLVLVLTAGIAFMFFGNNSTPVAMVTGQHKVNILVLGVDERADDVGRSDTMFVITIDPKTKEVSMLSVPRDTRVKIPGHGLDKINHAYAFGGHKLSQQAVEDLLGVKMDHYVLINFAGFFKIVDALGGVDVNVEKRMYYEDPYDNLVIDLKPGMQHLNSKTAIQYVRYRDEEGDLGRIKRQQHFIKAVIEKVTSPSVITKIPDLIREVSAAVKTDMSTTEMLSVAKTFHDAYQNGLETYTVPGKPAYIGDISYWLPNIVELRQQVAKIEGTTFDERSVADARKLENEYEGSIPREMKVIDVPKVKQTAAPQTPNKPAVPAMSTNAKLRIEILNGSGSPEAGERVSALLRSQGWNVVSVGTTGITSRTTVTAHSKNSNVVSKLQSLPFDFSLKVNDDGSSVQGTVVIGKDYIGK